MVKYTPKDFAHLIPSDAENKEDILYGVTNYAVYVDLEILDNGGGGGFSVLPNGSRVHASNTNYNAGTAYYSGGYFFQFQPGINGFLFRYYCFSNQGYGKLGAWMDGGRFDNESTLSWGVRPMYFYDAAKENYPAPGAVSFFKTAGDPALSTENFNENAVAESAAKINYRLPFSTLTAGFASQITEPTNFTTAKEGRARSFSDFVWISSTNIWGGKVTTTRTYASYGTMYGQDTDFSTPYSPKHMQSWHLYPGTNVADMLTNAKNDGRIGFRWDRSWHMYASGGTAAVRQRPLWEKRHILKLTILEVTRDILAKEVDSDWRYKIHHTDGTPVTSNQLTMLADNDVIHKAGDLFVRAEIIHLKKGAVDWNNSRNYVYSKPIWYGKFKGDAWRGDDPSPFKKLGNTMQHIVADPEPEEGDDQSYRRRNMRVRSWKESFLGWDFSTVTLPSYRYVWRDFVNGTKKTHSKEKPFDVADDGQKKFPPDFFETVYDTGGRVGSGNEAAQSVWTPPIAIDLNNEEKLTFTTDTKSVAQSGVGSNDVTFGLYTYANQYLTRERRLKSGGGYAYGYNGKYTSYIYGRLSVLRPWRDDKLPNQTTPIFGLYAMRGWDFGINRARGDDHLSEKENANLSLYDNPDPVSTSKRFLHIVQGLQLPYRPFPNNSGARREPSTKDETYTTNRERVLGLRFWENEGASRIRLYDIWLGEGFSPREVRAILGLTTNDKKTIRGTYVDSKMETAGFYMPKGEY
jgi:hypothetical protein